MPRSDTAAVMLSILGPGGGRGARPERIRLLDEVRVDEQFEGPSPPSAVPEAPRQSTGPLRVQFAPSFDSIREEWDAIAFQSRNIFSTYEWVSAWSRHQGAAARLFVATGRDVAGSLLAVVPLAVQRWGPFSLVRFAGGDAATQLAPVAGPTHRQAAAVALHGALERLPSPWDAFIGERLAADEGWPTYVGDHDLRTEFVSVLRPGGDRWDRGLIRSRSTLIKDVRRRERELTDAHGLRYRLLGSAERLDHDLDRFFALGPRPKTRDVRSAQREAFEREFMAAALSRGWLRLRFLEVDGATAAAACTFRYAGRETAYRFVSDAASGDATLATLLRVHVVAKAFEEGVTEFVFFGETQDRLANAEASLVTVAMARGVTGRVAVGLQRAALRARRSRTRPHPRALTRADAR